MIAKQPRPKKCKNPACGISFPPQRLGQAVCSPKCGLAIKDVNQAKARKSLAQVERREIKVRKEKLKSRADHLREAQAAVNEYVRLRDAHLPCISCDSRPNDNDLMTGSRWDAGHYRSVGACPELRFEPLNIHRQCVKCNRNLSGNAVEYRIRLVSRIGAEKVAWLEGLHLACKYTEEEIKAIKAK
ncbi:recombination protein NinG [Pseudomonas sp. MUP55]|uniref:recombination protein NinG n=1 Tax=Pseudomonas sp. MUP55 TaxID=3087234 RepID=UPI002A5A67A7|nr:MULTISPECIES: recombination protein NinG [unclassified Pseudomonas]WPN90315.1 recombination protein NinG [Pseudomonas sp. MUP56]WPN95840.1 recombination protein NinG [Pseudomonas sp. MUP55]